MLLQSNDLLTFTSLDDNAKSEITAVCIECAERLTECHAALSWLENYRRRVLEAWEGNKRRVIPLVPLEPVKPKAEGFLTGTRDCLRDATGLLRLGFGIRFKEDEASVFRKQGGKEAEAVKRLIPLIGEEHDLITFLRTNEDWLAELIEMRNAASHPRRERGPITIENFEFPSDGELQFPRWYRPPARPTPLIEEVSVLFGHLLMFCEGLVAHVVSHHLLSHQVRVVEDPAARGTELPRRFYIKTDVPLASE